MSNNNNDDFDEFVQVEEEEVVSQHETPAIIIESDLMPTIEEEGDLSGIPQYLIPETSQPDDINEKDFNNRRKYEKVVQQKLNQIHAIMERLYVVRYDDSRDQQDVMIDTKNLLAELNRLNEEYSQLREKTMINYAKTLNLDDLGISKRIRTRSFRKPSKVEFDDSDNETSGLMRTKSTKTLKGKDASDKWGSLFRMFREWKFQREVAEAQHIAESKGPNKLLEEEETKLRAAIYKLSHRNTLSKNDQYVLKMLKAKLRALHELNE